MGRRTTWVATRAAVTAWAAAALAALPTPGAAVQAAQQGARGEVLRVVRPQGWIGLTFDLEQTWQTGAAGAVTRMVISEVFGGSPADRIGLQVGDTILRINRRPVSWAVLEELQSTLEPGATVAFQVRRDGRNRNLAVRAGSRPADDQLERLLPEIRVQVQSAQAALREQLDSATRYGFVAASGSMPRTLLMLRTPDDSVVFSFQGDGSGTMRIGDAFDGPWVLTSRPTPAPFEGVVVRQPPAQAAGSQPRRSETAARQAELDVVRAGVSEAARALAEIEQHRRPLAPYILGQDVIAGAKLAPLNPDLAQYFGISRGLLVVDVLDGTLAADAGVLSGDVIVASGSRSVTTVEELRSVFASPLGGEAVRLMLVRKGRRLQVSVPR